MYRFLITARWLGLTALTIALVGLMILAGRWQLDRYHERSDTNARIDAARTAAPVPVHRALPAPGGTPGVAGPPAPRAAEWSRVGMTGRYDRAHTILARGRTHEGQVGFEVLTPLLLGDGAAVLVDRGWLPAPPGDASIRPALPPVPSGQVTIAGRVARSESRPGPLQRTGGLIEVRRLAVGQIAAQLPYPVYGSPVLLDADQPGGDPALRAVPSPRESAWQNAGYVVQWWMFALLTIGAFGWLARREALGPPAEGGTDRAGDPGPDRVDAADRAAGADRAAAPGERSLAPR